MGWSVKSWKAWKIVNEINDICQSKLKYYLEARRNIGLLSSISSLKLDWSTTVLARSDGGSCCLGLSSGSWVQSEPPMYRTSRIQQIDRGSWSQLFASQFILMLPINVTLHWRFPAPSAKHEINWFTSQLSIEFFEIFLVSNWPVRKRKPLFVGWSYLFHMQLHWQPE